MKIPIYSFFRNLELQTYKQTQIETKEIEDSGYTNVNYTAQKIQ